MIIFLVTVGAALAGVVIALRDPEYRTLAIAVVLLLAGGTVFYHNLEGWTWLDSLYFCVVALLTIGFGDFVPTTPASKIFTIAYLFIGVGLIATFVQLLIKKRQARSTRSGLPFSRQDSKDDRDRED